MKTLIIYYSQARGNTRRIAEMMQHAFDADMAGVETVTPYTGSYEDIVEQGQEEVNSGYMPAIQPLTAELSAYDCIILGTPTWWYTMAPAMKTFLHENDLSGKNVLLFQTHGGWPGHVFADMKAMMQGSVMGALSVQFDATGGDMLLTPIAEIEQEIEKWRKSVIFT